MKIDDKGNHNLYCLYFYTEQSELQNKVTFIIRFLYLRKYLLNSISLRDELFFQMEL